MNETQCVACERIIITNWLMTTEYEYYAVLDNIVVAQT